MCMVERRHCVHEMLRVRETALSAQDGRTPMPMRKQKVSKHDGHNQEGFAARSETPLDEE